MRVSLDDIRDEGLVRDFVASVDEFSQLQELVATGEVVFAAPLAVRLRMLRSGELVEVEGQVQTSVWLACGRCLGEYVAPLAAGFSLTFARTLPEVEDESGDVELTAEDLGMTLLEGDEIDFHAAVQEQVLLALPLRPLCSEGCRGLCPHCGIDLNVALCECHNDGFGNKFSVLRNFKVEK